MLEQDVLAPPAIRTAFQPIVDLRERSVYAWEALARGPAGEPAAWVFAHVDIGARGALDHAVRLGAMRAARRLGMHERLSVNLFPQTEGCPTASMKRTLGDARREGFPPGQLIFEITESTRVNQPARLRDFVALHREFGFKTAIDDFGAGYSSFQLLSEFRPDILKIDMQFTRHAPHDPRGRTLIRHLVSIAADLGCDLIAEGVETRDESSILLELGIWRQQGFLFSAPLVEQLPLVHWPAQPALAGSAIGYAPRRGLTT